MKKALLLTVFLILFFTFWYYYRHPLTTRVKIRNTVFRVDVAVTNEEKARGLGGRDALAPDTGMLFAYDHKEQFRFWMKDMRFPLDFIWIDGKTVVGVTENAPQPGPGGQLPVYAPKAAVDKILEVNAGTVQKLGIQPGDLISISN